MAFNKVDNKYYGYIYKIYNTENDKIYIGQTRRSIQIRWSQHILDAKGRRDTNTVLYNAMNKYGIDKFNIQMIKEYSFDNKEKLIKILNNEEIKYILQYNTIMPNGYNMQRGGKSATESLKRPVDKYYTNGEFIASYESILSACDDSETELNRVHIAECCDGILYTSSGFVWRDKGEPFDKYKTSDKRVTPVSQYTKDGKFIKYYNSMKEAIYEVFGTTEHKKYSSHITSCCKGDRKTAYGFVWRYENEPFDKY